MFFIVLFFFVHYINTITVRLRCNIYIIALTPIFIEPTTLSHETASASAWVQVKAEGGWDSQCALYLEYAMVEGVWVVCWMGVGCVVRTGARSPRRVRGEGLK